MMAFFARLLPEHKISGTVVALFSNRAIQRSVQALFGLFVPIFLLEKYNSISLVLLFYLAISILYALFAPIGAIIASKISFKKSLIISVAGGTIYYLTFYFFDWHIALFSVIAILALTWDKLFLWVPYHSAFAKFTDAGSRGRTLALIRSAITIVAAGLPLVAGYVIAQHGYSTIILIVVALYLSSAIPFFFVNRINEQYSFGYWQTWKIFFNPRNRRMVLSYMAVGIEDSIWLIIWPIFLWQLFAGDYLAVGLITSLILLATIFIRLLVGRYTDKVSKQKMLLVGSILDALGWVGKIFVTTGFQVFAISTYHNMAKITSRNPFDAIMYERAADAGHYVDEYTVLREMSIHVGRIILIPIIILLLQFAGISYAFLIAALAALVMNLI